MQDQNQNKKEAIQDATADEVLDVVESIPKSFYAKVGNYLIEEFHKVTEILEDSLD